MNNKMSIEFLAKSINESFARLVVIGFIAPLDPSAQEITEVKTIVSEAVTNAIIHGYDSDETGIITLSAEISDQSLRVCVKDNGSGISNIEEAKQPLFTTKQEEERSGLGFMIMESFSDSFMVQSEPGVGTTITFEKHFVSHDQL